MPSIRGYPATVVALVLSLLSVLFVILTQTNVLLSPFPVLLLLGVGLVVDLVPVSQGSPREYPATLVALPVAVGVMLLTVLTATSVLVGAYLVAPLLPVAVLYDLAPISLRSPRQCRAILVSIPIIALTGAYTILTATNVLLWIFFASLLFGIAVILDWIAFEYAN